MNYKRNINIDNLYTSNKYNELIYWINSFETYFCKSVKTISDLNNGNVYIDLLRNYCKQNNKKYFLTLLNFSIRHKNITQKMKTIFRIMLQLINNNQIKSRIKIFQRNINNFMNDNNMLMELVIYINSLFKNNIYNNNDKIYNNKKDVQKNSLKEFYDYNNYKRIIINNFINDNDNKYLNTQSYKFRPKSYNKNIPKFDNFIKSINKLDNSNVKGYKNIYNKFNEDNNIKNGKSNILLTEQDNKRINSLNNFDKINSYIPFNLNIEDYIDHYNQIPNDIQNKEKEDYNYNYNKYVLGIFDIDKINFTENKETINIFKIYRLTNPILINNNFLGKINSKLITNKEIINKKETFINNNKDNNLNVHNSHNNLENKYKFSLSANLSPRKTKENKLFIKSTDNNVNTIENKIKINKSNILRINKNNINNNKGDKEILSSFKLLTNNTISNEYQINNKYLNIYNKFLIQKNNDNDNINKNDIFTWLLDLNIIKKKEANNNLLTQLVSDGIILCDLINKCENKIVIDEIFRDLSSKKEALMNINKALEFLSKLENFPKRHVFDNELIFELDDKIIWEILYDLYNYYNKKNEKKITSNKLNNTNDLKNDLLSTQRIEIQFKKNELSHDYNDKNNKIYNKNKKIVINNDNLNKYNSNILMNSDNFYNSNNKNEFINNKKFFDNNDIKKSDNFDNNKLFSISHQRNLSENYENNKNYFDYVDELKNYFDKIKVKKQWNKDTAKNKEINIFKNSNKNYKDLYFDYNSLS